MPEVEVSQIVVDRSTYQEEGKGEEREEEGKAD